MKRIRDENSTDLLKRIARRVEEATVDIHEMKSDLKMMKFRLNSLETNSDIVKIDVEKTRRDIEKLTKNNEDLIDIASEIPSNMVTQKELSNLEHRLVKLEHLQPTTKRLCKCFIR